MVNGGPTETWGLRGDERRDGAVVVPPRWRLIRKLGEGGQAVVWLAEDRELDELVALKLFGDRLDERARERLRREVRIGRRIKHPNILRIYDLVEFDGHLMAVMEAMSGGTLADRIEREGMVPVDDVVEIAQALLSALAALHEEGIVHRDVKPSNVLFASDGTPRLGDLGLVRDVEGDRTLTETRSVVGTPTYMAPEQLRGERPAPAWDLYALGVTLFEALTGRPPYLGDSSFEVADAHLHGRTPRLRTLCRECPRWLARFVERLLEKEPENRWPSAQEALEAFQRRRIARSRRARRRLVLTAAAVVVALAGTVAAWRQYSASVTPVRVQLLEHSVEALDDAGHELWRYHADFHRALVRMADFLPIRGEEVLLCRDGLPVDATRLGVGVTILDRRGREIGTWRLERFRQWEDISPSWIPREVLTADVDGDGYEEAAIFAAHTLWYPAAISIWSPGGERPSFRTSLLNSGAVKDFLLEDLNGDGLLDLVFSALNNQLGFQTVVGAVDGRRLLRGGPVLSPDLAVERPSSVDRSMDGELFYTPLGSQPMDLPTDLRVTEAGIEVRLGDGPLVLDGDGNPSGSPLSGQGPSVRQRFWRGLVQLYATLRRQPGRWRETFEGFRQAHQSVLEEKPSDLACSLMAARALEDERAYAAAETLLEEATNRIHGERDLWLRLGEVRLIAGDRAAGWDALARSAVPDGKGRNAYDVLVLLMLDGALHVDSEAYTKLAHVLERFDGWESYGHFVEGERPTLWFCGGDWQNPRFDDVTIEDCLQFVRWLLEWRNMEIGQLTPEAVIERVEARAGSDDYAALARILEAEALRRLGDPVKARAIAEPALAKLDRKGRRSYESFAWIPLAEWELGRCLLDQHHVEEAVPHLRRAAQLAPATWFGRDAAQRLRTLQS